MTDDEILEQLEKKMHTDYRTNKEREFQAKKEYNMSDLAIFMKKLDEQYSMLEEIIDRAKNQQEETRNFNSKIEKEIENLKSKVNKQSELLKVLIETSEITDLPDKIKF